MSDLLNRLAADWSTLLFTAAVNAAMVSAFIAIDRKYDNKDKAS